MVVTLYSNEVRLRLFFVFYCSITVTLVCYSYLQEVIYLLTYYYCIVNFDFFIFTSYKDFFSLYILVLVFIFLNIFLIMFLCNCLLYLSNMLGKLKVIFWFYVFCLVLLVNYFMYRIIFTKALPMAYTFLHSKLVDELVLYRYISVEMNIITVIKVFIYLYFILFIISLFSVIFIIKILNDPDCGGIFRNSLTVFNIFIILVILPGDVVLHIAYLVSIYIFYESLYIVLIYIRNYYFLLKKK